MGLPIILKAFGSKFHGLIKARKIKSAIFSGTPVLTGITALKGPPQTWSLLYRNGLMLTLGEAGILDYQDRKFGHFMGGPGKSAAPDNREFLVQLHKIVLKSLLRYIIHPGLNAAERERAAEAASKLWLATEERPGETRDYSRVDDGSWSAGASRESAPYR
ncbi:MAG: hypothetical protein M3Y08_15005 [Fibrobacterota bacterium]|nr:hypothetical protein [Fibrobacterota bacterium]